MKKIKDKNPRVGWLIKQINYVVSVYFIIVKLLISSGDDKLHV